MSNAKNTPIIIRKTQVTAAAGHHGGAWKVAYADFVTAMMAFFLLLWLLNATTEKQREGLADYFNPTLIHERNGGADTLEGQNTPPSPAVDGAEATSDAFTAMAEQIQAELKAAGGESMQNLALLRHVVTRITDEGLVIELGDLTDESLFVEETATPTPALRELARIVANALARTRNELAFSGHVASISPVRTDSPAWPLSGERAHAVRDLIQTAGLDRRRMQRVTAYGDRRNRDQNPMDAANNRVEVILLR